MKYITALFVGLFILSGGMAHAESQDLACNSGTGATKMIVRGPCMTSFVQEIFSGCRGMCGGNDSATLTPGERFAGLFVSPAYAKEPGKCKVKEAQMNKASTASSQGAEVEGRCNKPWKPPEDLPGTRRHMTTQISPGKLASSDGTPEGFFRALFVIDDDEPELIKAGSGSSSLFPMQTRDLGGWFKLNKRMSGYKSSSYGTDALPEDGNMSWRK
jgi:hypothetical protein